METNKITWEDFKSGLSNLSEMSSVKYSKTNIICPKCGQIVYLDNETILTSYPPKRIYKCLMCGWRGYI